MTFWNQEDSFTRTSCSEHFTESNMTTEKFASQYGEPSERAKGKVVSYLSPFVQQFIEKTPLIKMATANQMAQQSARKPKCRVDFLYSWG